MGRDFEVLLFVHLRIVCILSEGGGPFVLPFQDSCKLVRASCLLYVGMNGNCHDMFGTV